MKLEQNYRSTNAILNAANAVIKNNADRREKRLWSDKGRGDPITLWEFRDDEEEAQAIVEELNYNRRIKKVKWRDQAILFRTNQQSRPLETALRKADIRYNLVGGQSFLIEKKFATSSPTSNCFSTLTTTPACSASPMSLHAA